MNETVVCDNGDDRSYWQECLNLADEHFYKRRNFDLALQLYSQVIENSHDQQLAHAYSIRLGFDTDGLIKRTLDEILSDLDALAGYREEARIYLWKGHLRYADDRHEEAYIDFSKAASIEASPITY